jgi:hypothetical protein
VEIAYFKAIIIMMLMEGKLMIPTHPRQLSPQGKRGKGYISCDA